MNINRFNRGQWSLSSQVIFTKTGELSVPPLESCHWNPDCPQIPALPRSRRRGFPCRWHTPLPADGESQWRGRRGRARSFGPGHPELSGAFRAAPPGEESSPTAAAAARPEPEVPRVPIAPARPAADRQFRSGPPSVSLRLAAAFQPGVLGPTGPTPKPRHPGQALTAGGLGRMRRHA